MTDYAAPRCSHGRIILGCPHDDCPEQNAYLEDQRKKMTRWDEQMTEQARLAVREAMRDELGLDVLAGDDQ